MTSVWHEEPEAAVVGSILVDSECIAEVAGDLLPDHFGHAALRRIYQTAIALWKKGEPFSSVDVLGQLNDKDQEVASECLAFTASTAHVKHYARQVSKEAGRREILRLAARLQSGAQDRQTDPAELIEEAATCLHKIQFSAVTDIHTLGGSLDEFYADLGERCRSEQAAGIPTPFRKLDDYIGGWEPELVYIIGARPSVGKSALGVQIGMRAGMRGYNVLYLILETSRKQWTRRVVSAVSGVSVVDMKTGRVGPEAMVEITAACGKLSKYAESITIWDAADCTPTRLMSEAMKRRRTRGLDMVIIDYIQLMQCGERVNSRQEAMASVSRAMTRVAKTLSVPVIALAQIKREVEGSDGKMRRPVLTDLKESGAFEQDAALVAFLHREDLLASSAELVIAKQRDGVVGGVVPLHFDKKAVKFVEVER